MAYKYINKTSAVSGRASIYISAPTETAEAEWSNRDGVYLQYTVSGEAYATGGYAYAYMYMRGTGTSPDTDSAASGFSLSSDERTTTVLWRGAQQFVPYDGRTCYAAPGESAILEAGATGRVASAYLGMNNVAIDQRHPNVYIAGGVWNGYGYQIV